MFASNYSLFLFPQFLLSWLFKSWAVFFFPDVYIFVCASTRWGQVLTKAQRTCTLFSLELPGVTVVVVNLTLWMMELNSGLWKSNSCFSGLFCIAFQDKLSCRAATSQIHWGRGWPWTQSSCLHILIVRMCGSPFSPSHSQCHKRYYLGTTFV